jgi:N4-gp56 family major capsid protein
MADPAGYTTTSAQAALVTAAVDRHVRAELRHAPLLRSVVDTRPVQVDKPGSSVKLYTYPNLAAATTPLTETADPDAVALGDPTPTTITLNEYGVSTIATIRLKQFSFSDIDPNQMDQVAYSMRDTLDTLVRNELSAGTNVLYSGDATSTATVGNDDVISSNDVRQAVTTLRRNAAHGKRGDLYWCGIHPDVAFDLKKETDAAGWRTAHVNAAPDLIWPGEIGVYEGAFFVESARMLVDDDGTAATPDANVYRTIFAGKEAIAEAVAIEPGARIGVVPDKLNRFFPLGWYGLLGWKRFRENALVRVESGSSFNA